MNKQEASHYLLKQEERNSLRVRLGLCVCVLVKLTTTVVTMLEPGVLGTNCALGFCFQEAFQWLRKWARLNKADLSNITSDTILGYPRG